MCQTHSTPLRTLGTSSAQDEGERVSELVNEIGSPLMTCEDDNIRDGKKFKVN